MKSPLRSRPAAATDYSQILRNIRRLIWLYIILLVIEGSLRKWIVPAYSNPILLIRDPVVLAIYLLALRAHVWPRNIFVISLIGIALLSWIVAIFVLDPYVQMSRILFVTAYGFRSNFLHLPLIFIFAKVLDIEEVKKIGWWFLLGMIPMGLIMALQFHASPDAFINRTVGLGESEQITAGGGKIRPPGTFSFISGPIYYVAASTAFVLYGALSRGTYRTWLLYSTGFGILLAVFVSGSRSLVVSVLLVALSLSLVLVIRPSAVNRFGRSLVAAVVVGLIISHIPLAQEGIAILSERFTASAEAAETTIAKGLVDRTIGGFTEGLRVINRIPLFGYGLGIGTNVGARAIVGRVAFLLAENEWSRVLLESGPILGLAFLIWRAALTAYLGYLSIRALARAEILPLLLFSAGFVVLLNGQLGQPTSLGFAVVLSGLCLTTTQRVASAELIKTETRPRLQARRSAYAERLHGAPHSNGSVDR